MGLDTLESRNGYVPMPMHQKIHSGMFLAAPFVRAASWQPARGSVPQQRATPEYYAVTSLNTLETHAATWANPAGAVLRGTSYGQSSKSRRIPFMSI